MVEKIEDLVRELAEERYSECYESCAQGGVPHDFTVDDFMEDAREFVSRVVAAHIREQSQPASS